MVGVKVYRKEELREVCLEIEGLLKKRVHSSLIKMGNTYQLLSGDWIGVWEVTDRLAYRYGQDGVEASYGVYIPQAGSTFKELSERVYALR